MARCFCGGIGGIVSLVALLIVGNGEPLAGYIENISVSGVDQQFIGYSIKVLGLFALGAFWAWINGEQNNLRAFQLGIAAPAIITGMIATYDAKKDQAPQKPSGQTWLFIAPAYAGDLPPAPMKRPSVFDNVIGGILNEPVTPNLPIAILPQRFSSDDRRSASDRLIQLYPDNKKAVVEAVVNSLKAPSKESYRNNIYAARTLGLIPGGWQGTTNQKDAIEMLKNGDDYQDQTFKAQVDRAIENWRPAPS